MYLSIVIEMLCADLHEKRVYSTTITIQFNSTNNIIIIESFVVNRIQFKAKLKYKCLFPSICFQSGRQSGPRTDIVADLILIARIFSSFVSISTAKFLFIDEITIG